MYKQSQLSEDVHVRKLLYYKFSNCKLPNLKYILAWGPAVTAWRVNLSPWPGTLKQIVQQPT